MAAAERAYGQEHKLADSANRKRFGDSHQTTSLCDTFISLFIGSAILFINK